MYGVIDIGSNTIRLVIYKAENGNIKEVLNKKTAAGLVGYINKKQNLSEKGIERAVEILSEYKEITDSIKLDGLYVFATAILRNIKNQAEVLDAIKDKCGFSVRILTGFEEANFGYEGTVKITKLESGVLADVGGGSTELVFYKNGKQIHSCSMPIGSLNLYTKCVKKILPRKTEIQEMKKVIKSELSTIDVSMVDFKPTALCAVGGTARTAHKLIRKINNPEDTAVYQCKQLKEIVEYSLTDTKDFTSAILKVAPERIHTIVPGILIMQTIAKRFGLKDVITSSYGVREGFLYSVLKEKAING